MNFKNVGELVIAVLSILLYITERMMISSIKRCINLALESAARIKSFALSSAIKKI